LGMSQLARLTDYVERRNVLAARYGLALGSLRLQLPTVAPKNRSAFHLYVVRVTEPKGRTHRQVFEELRRRGIGVNLHYTPVHLQPYYRQLGFRHGQFPEAEAYAETALTLPLYPTMTEAQQDSVVAALQAAL
jgi:dTDP-4-amino-4,6-dideoxygalactose transaminase